MNWLNKNDRNGGEARRNAPPQSSPDGRPGGTASGSGWPSNRLWMFFLLALVLNYLVAYVFVPGPEEPVTIPYTVFKDQVASDNVQAIYSQGEKIEGRFRSPVTYPPPRTAEAPPETRPSRRLLEQDEPRTSIAFRTVVPAFVDPGLEALLIEHEVEISAKPIEIGGSGWATLLFGFGPAILFIAFYIWLIRRTARRGGMAGGMFGLGKSKAQRYDKDKTTGVTFDDVAGIDEAEAELAEIVDFLKQPQKYTRLGGTAPKGVLLVGAPGTGKTLLARAVAGEAGVPFYSMSAAEFVEMIVGVGAARVRDLFKEARAHAPSIIFIDEIDAIGRAP